jgi:UDP-glucose 4-epimerase
VKVLVTGGSGFIGSHVVDSVARAGHDVRIFDLIRSPYRDDIDVVTGDLGDVETLRAASEGCDCVVHLAAVSDVNDVVANPARAEAVNVQGTANVLEAVRAEKVPRVVFASTIWVYGGTRAAIVDEDTPLAEPEHYYTETKRIGEDLCRDSGVEHTILRFGIPYGPRARAATVLAAFVARAEAGKALSIAGDGRQSRRFVYVEDLAEGVVAALSPVAADRTFNLVGAESVTIREIADSVRELVADVPIVHVPGREGDLGSVEVSGERAARELGWRAQTPFAEGARRYVEWTRAGTVAAPAISTASRMRGNAAAVIRQEPGEL